ncbi:MAG: FumA C-terminus/TtdB family hydratase beta subunit [Candidatus Methanomethyliaceae archaeon]|nr:FumA C-terminus/TtdB family hydratase beta subunit [Candidatus Methanomethyliaceae archaeon]
MRILKLNTILNENDVRELKVGDVIFFTGIIFTMRDMAHLRALEIIKNGEKLPFDLKNKIIYHCGPLIKNNKVISAGPTTSMRMELFEKDLIMITGLRGIIGKGGMGENTRKALKEHGAVYMEFPGGAGALAAKSILGIKEVYWKDLGEPEAVWILEVKDFGPCFVTMDSLGNVLGYF